MNLLLKQDKSAPPYGYQAVDRVMNYAFHKDAGALEQARIFETEAWAFSHRRDVLDERFLKALHRRLFGHVWSWAGEFRLSDDDQGSDPFLIPSNIQQLISECADWIGQRSESPQQVAARWHHRLIRIRPFLDGNELHAKMSTDLLLVELGQSRFSWGTARPRAKREVCNAYASALHAADHGEVGPLLELLRS